MFGFKLIVFSLCYWLQWTCFIQQSLPAKICSTKNSRTDVAKEVKRYFLNTGNFLLFSFFSLVYSKDYIKGTRFSRVGSYKMFEYNSNTQIFTILQSFCTNFGAKWQTLFVKLLSLSFAFEAVLDNRHEFSLVEYILNLFLHLFQWFQVIDKWNLA